MADFKKEHIQALEPLFEKVIALQKRSNLQDFYQQINLETKFGVKLIDLISDKKTFIDQLNDMNLNFKFSIINKLDEIILTFIKTLDE